MAALLLALKALGLLVLALLILLALALAVPITIKLAYAHGQFTVRLGVLVYTRQLWPEPPPRPARKPRRKRRQAGAKAAPSPAAHKAPAPGPDAPAAAPQTPPDAVPAEQPPPPSPSAPPAQNGAAEEKEFTVAGVPLRRVLDLLPTVGEVGRRILAGLRVHTVRLYWPIQGEDAADTALRYGAFCAAWGSAVALVQNLVRVQCDQVQPVADYLGEHTGEEHFSCKITARVFIMVAAAVYGFFRLRRLAETQTN